MEGLGVTLREPEPIEAEESGQQFKPNEVMEMGRFQRKVPAWWDGEEAADSEAANVLQYLERN